MGNEFILPVILAGGGGTRLWPLSRARHGKPFLDLTGNGTLLKQTLQRAATVTDAAPLIICGEEERFLAAEELRSSGISEAHILLEPIQRNTAPALTLAALEATRNGSDAILLVMPSDHKIDGEDFEDAIAEAVTHAQLGKIVALAVPPAGPRSDFGYLRLGNSVEGSGAQEVEGFIEKPHMETAEALIGNGDAAWNAGIFVLRASRWLEEIERQEPAIAETCRKAFRQRSADMDFIRVGADALADCPSISIDYAVMERTELLVAVPFDAGWSDLGTFNALAEALPKDTNDNAIVGDVLTKDSHRNLLHAQSRLLAVSGLDDMVVVETPDAVFVAPRGGAYDAGAMAGMLAEENRPEASHHLYVPRPWGSYVVLSEKEGHMVKRITVNPGKSLSLQRHRYRSEHWMVASGVATVEVNGTSHLLYAHQSIDISIGDVHALANETDDPLVVIEVQMGELLDEDDIERLEDRYGRA